MFIRNLSVQLKPNTLTDFRIHFENDVLPTLRKQKGFHHQLIFGTPGTDSVTAISFWDTRQNADLYAGAIYPEMLKKMSKFLDGTPKVHIAELIYSTFGEIATAATAAVNSTEAKTFAA
jgi:hypothetical protein